MRRAQGAILHYDASETHCVCFLCTHLRIHVSSLFQCLNIECRTVAALGVDFLLHFFEMHRDFKEVGPGGCQFAASYGMPHLDDSRETVLEQCKLHAYNHTLLHSECLCVSEC